MRKTTLVAALLATAFATGAQAQICAGFPTVDGGFSLGGRVDFPDGGDSFGVEGSYNARGPLSVFGGLDVVSVEGVDNSDQDVFSVGVALETPRLGAALGPRVSVCPQAQLQFADSELGTAFAVPVGLGFGTDLAFGTGTTLSPYVIPQVVFSRFDPEVEIPGVESGTETNFGVRGGALVGLGIFFVGGEVGYFGGGGGDTTFGIRGGVRF